ncbi:hypothetical protein J4731_16945 [Providencia rettgeri]|nr:hypothetical protein [Providencia rettgeri]
MRTAFALLPFLTQETKNALDSAQIVAVKNLRHQYFSMVTGYFSTPSSHSINPDLHVGKSSLLLSHLKPARQFVVYCCQQSCPLIALRYTFFQQSSGA